MTTRALQKLVHVGCRALGIADEDERRDLYERITGKRSLRLMTESEQDGAIFLTAAFTGLRRGELVALRWRDVDFPARRIRVSGSFAGGQLTTPKSGKLRSVPLAPDVAAALAEGGQKANKILAANKKKYG